MTAREQHDALTVRVGVASWYELWAAVDNVINEHQPRMSASIDTLSCPNHSVAENPEGHLAALRASRPYREIPRVFEDCPNCVVTPIVVCSGNHCCDGWPCDTVGAVMGALNISWADLQETT